MATEDENKAQCAGASMDTNQGGQATDGQCSWTTNMSALNHLRGGGGSSASSTRHSSYVLSKLATTRIANRVVMNTPHVDREDAHDILSVDAC
jgi:hypothetical protein